MVPQAGQTPAAALVTALAPLRNRRNLGGVFLPLLAAVLAAALVGCGSTDNGVAAKPASEILAASTAAADSATSVHVLSKTKVNGITTTVDLRLTRGGGRSSLSLARLSYKAIQLGNDLYVTGNRVFFIRLGQMLGGRAGAAAAKLPVGTWVKAPAAGSSLAGLGSLTDMSSELHLILSRGPAVKGSETTVNGQKAVTLKQAGKFYKRSLYIATTGKPYPIQIIRESHANAKALRQSAITTFSGWNAPIALSAPTNTVDISQLEGGGH
jgi:hypothetical protein